MKYVSMPMQIVLKSSKIIPVMAAGVFITGKRFSTADYLSAALLAAGVAVFSFAGGNASAAAASAPASGGADGGAGARAAVDAAAAGTVLIGSAILSVTLCCDALLGNFQA